jgi:hypothetical protein
MASEILNSDANKIYDLFFVKKEENQTKASQEISDKKVGEIPKEGDLDNFSFEEKKESPAVNETTSKENQHPIKEEIVQTVVEDKHAATDIKVDEINNSDKVDIETKFEELKINQETEVKMIVDEKPSANNEVTVNKQANSDAPVQEGQHAAEPKVQPDDKIIVDSEVVVNKEVSQVVEEKRNDPQEDVKMTQENVPEEQKNQDIVKEIDLLDYLFSFLDSEGELNYVLCGYFAKLMTTLLNKNAMHVKSLITIVNSFYLGKT